MDKVLFQFPEIVRIVGGTPYHFPLGERQGISSVISDSRQAVRGCLFVPLKGERTDGHYYIQEVFARGGRVSFVAEDFWAKNKDTLQSYAVQYLGSYIIVSSPLIALHKLAESYLRKKKTHRIGITGSNGKTTTKEILGTILKQNSTTFMNRGNLNSEIGLPLSVFEVPDETQWVVLEMGMNHAGEIKSLVEIVKPEIGVITNIGMAHIGNLGSQEAIAAEKKQVFVCLPKDGVAFLYEKEPFASFLREGVRAKIKTYGEESTPGFEGAENLNLKGWKIKYEGKSILFPLVGNFNLRNALAAISVCRELGVGISNIQAGLERVKPLFGRGQIVGGAVTVLIDCYNANPNSMKEALEFLHQVEWKGRKIGVFGEMKELGSFEVEAHRNLASWIMQNKLDGVFLYGEAMEVTNQILRDSSFPTPVFFPENLESLGNQLKQYLKAGDIVLLKGSRSTALEGLLKDIMPIGSEDSHV